MDDVWGDLTSSVKFAGNVVLSKVDHYVVSYGCTNPAPWRKSAPVIKRDVHVKDLTKPKCVLKGKPTVVVEASFPYSDSGAMCVDSFDGAVSFSTTGKVDIETAGVYKLTYHAEDKAGNEAKLVFRTVEVKDTLKPVIGLSVGGKYIHISDGADTGVNGENNPASKYYSLMAESSGTGAWILGAAAAVVGVALVAFAQNKETKTLVPV